MKQNIIVIDDFYDNPEEVRNAGLNAEYPVPEEGFTYPGKNSNNEFYNREIHSKFEDILKQPLIPAKPNGYFRISLEKDSFRQDVHVDPSWEFGAVLYLSLPEHSFDEAGTSFWRHNTLNIEHIPQNNEEAQFHGYPSYKEAWWTTVYGDGLDRNKWTRYFMCPMRYNRLVIFRTHLWHSHNVNFGDCMENGRLVQLFFFNPDEEWHRTLDNTVSK